MAPRWKLITAPLSGMALLLGEVMAAAHRADLPSFQNQDPSGVFGEAGRPPLRIVALGDSSITAPGVEPLDAAWIRRIAHDLAQHFHVELVSVAVGGSKARDVLAEQLPTALTVEADLAILSVGANDALRATSLRRFEHDIADIVRQLAEHTPAVVVCGVGDLGTIPRLPTVPRAYARVRGRSFDRALGRVAARYPNAEKTAAWGVHWAPFRDPASGVFAPDLFHASAEGHAIFASSAAPAVQRALTTIRRGAPARRGGRESST